MDAETSKVLDAAWYHDDGYRAGFSMRVVSCGDTLTVRMGWRQTRMSHYGEEIWRLQAVTESYTNFSNQ